MCQDFSAAVTRCNRSPERLCATVSRLSLPKRTPCAETEEISCYRNGQSAPIQRTHTLALSGGAEQRCAGPLSSARVRMIAMDQRAAVLGSNKIVGLTPLSPTLRPSVRPHGQRDMDNLSPLRPASRSQGANARCRQCERRHGAARRSGCRPACLRSRASARLRRELQGSKSGY